MLTLIVHHPRVGKPLWLLRGLGTGLLLTLLLGLAFGGGVWAAWWQIRLPSLTSVEAIEHDLAKLWTEAANLEGTVKSEAKLLQQYAIQLSKQVEAWDGLLKEYGILDEQKSPPYPLPKEPDYATLPSIDMLRYAVLERQARIRAFTTRLHLLEAYQQRRVPEDKLPVVKSTYVQKTEAGEWEIATEPGAEVYSVSEGIVGFAGMQKGHGVVVELLHTGGVKTRYAHLAETTVKTGDWVEAGKVLGVVQVGENQADPYVLFSKHSSRYTLAL